MSDRIRQIQHVDPIGAQVALDEPGVLHGGKPEGHVGTVESIAYHHAQKGWRLETGLAVGGLLAVVGFVGDVWVFRQWSGGGYGEFHQMRGIIFWSMWFFLGVQLVFSSFFLSMLGISRGTYIGDYDRK